MQKRNIMGIERIIYLMTKKLEKEKGGPSNKSAVALARLVSALNRSTRGTGSKAKGLADMSPEELKEYHEEHGDPNFADQLMGLK